jgi:hypothetical protein
MEEVEKQVAPEKVLKKKIERTLEETGKPGPT